MFVRLQRALFCACAVSYAITFLAIAPARADNDFLTRAIPLAQKSQRATSVPASVTLAQATWETGRGRSPIGDANNYFGIKAAGSSDDNVNVGPIAIGWVWAWTKEWDGKKLVEQRERFRKYASMEDSFRDHGVLLATNPRYAEAMRAVDDPREFARRIAAAGYATSPTYARDLIRVMDAENLYQYDLPRNALELLSKSETLAVQPGEIFQIYFDIKNTGFGTWSPTADYYLASANENRFGSQGRQELEQLVPPEHVKRWALTMVAPRDAGMYSTTWQFKHGTQNVGALLSVQIQVQAETNSNVWLWGAGAGLIAAGVAGYFFVAHTKKNPARRTFA